MNKQIDNIVDMIVNEVKWWYDIGAIETINTEAIAEVIDSLFPEGVPNEESDNLIFRVKMAI